MKAYATGSTPRRKSEERAGIVDFCGVPVPYAVRLRVRHGADGVEREIESAHVRIYKEMLPPNFVSWLEADRDRMNRLEAWIVASAGWDYLLAGAPAGSGPMVGHAHS